MIKSGYQITLFSWENDGDYDKCVVVSGLTKARVEYVISMCTLFISGNHGNMCDHNNNQLKMVAAKVDMLKVAEQYSDVLVESELQHITRFPVDYMIQFLSVSEGYHFRAFDSYIVHYFPTDIVDVTYEFFNV